MVGTHWEVFIHNGTNQNLKTAWCIITKQANDIASCLNVRRPWISWLAQCREFSDCRIVQSTWHNILCRQLQILSNKFNKSKNIVSLATDWVFAHSHTLANTQTHSWEDTKSTVTQHWWSTLPRYHFLFFSAASWAAFLARISSTSSWNKKNTQNGSCSICKSY